MSSNLVQPGVSVITPTGGRPFAFQLCKEYLQRQIYDGPLQWVIVDDCIPQERPTWGRLGWEITEIYPHPSWHIGQNTLARNLLAALDTIKYDNILIMEDDDWYAVDYIQTMSRLLRGAWIAGCSQSRYYHIPSGKYRVMRHPGTSSLCHTGFRELGTDYLRDVCQDIEFIDRRFWEKFTPLYKTLIDIPLCTGIKGLPGRPGIGMGHRPDDNEDWRQDDSDHSVLKRWIGRDAWRYDEFHKEVLPCQTS